MKSPSDCNTNAILLLDDEFDITFSFKQGLEDKGYRVFGFIEPLLALKTDFIRGFHQCGKQAYQ
jgi:hypothetical protein